MPITSTAGDLWIRRFHQSDGTTDRLICLPHGGGSASFFYPMSQALTAHTDVLAVQYPGRQDRRDEPPLTDLHRMADDIAGALAGWVDRPFSFFGHSMGALLAYEVTLRLQRVGVHPMALFVSGARPPGMTRNEGVHRLSDEGLVSHLSELSGTEPTLLADAEIVSLILPAVRGDYQAVELYEHRGLRQVSCPIVVLTGDDDPAVTPAQAGGWAEYTTAGCDVHVFPGDHFYLVAEQKAVLAAVSRRLSAIRQEPETMEVVRCSDVGAGSSYAGRGGSSPVG